MRGMYHMELFFFKCDVCYAMRFALILRYMIPPALWAYGLRYPRIGVQNWHDMTMTMIFISNLCIICYGLYFT